MMARYIPDIHAMMRRERTYELSDGRRVRLADAEIHKYGVEKLLHMMGEADDPALMPHRPVYWCGEMVGTVPHSFHPYVCRSRTFLYEPRRGDFIEQGNGWMASPSLGPGDIAAIEGFRPT